ncbi:hypothetical protein PMAYCL1PPCAC_04615 [Pristionchus mayeri]|uniref:G-protein coupled receptors family 1 profile domain-containing protein n=1 Tax=Pristionchus mayeri TaxID=1317129 RepID=A0AAN4ZB01_9BILA|nr:hypothetical protein PMAYCL1PPCAC_04615 [Pristionchus mayeri]
MAGNFCSSSFSIPSDSAFNFILKFLASVNRDVYLIVVFFIGPLIMIMNSIDMLIMSRKELRSPYNFVLFLMAIDQTIVIGALVLPLLRSLFNTECSPSLLSLPWALYDLLVIVNLMPLCKAHGTWLAVILAGMRLASVKSNGTFEFRLNMVILLSGGSLLFVVLTNVPNFLSFSIQWMKFEDACNSTDYGELMIPYVGESHVLFENDCLILRMGSIFTGAIHSALACVMLIVFTVVLLRFLRVVRKKRQEMVLHKNSKESPGTDRTTILFILIMLSTMISEFPLALLGMLEGLLSYQVRAQITSKINLLTTSLIVITSTVNLFIYLFMSKKVRQVGRF